MYDLTLSMQKVIGSDHANCYPVIDDAQNGNYCNLQHPAAESVDGGRQSQSV